MTEILNRPVETPKQPEDMSAFEAMLEDSSATVERPSLSPLADKLSRLTNLLETRAINKAHGEAIKEDKYRTKQDQQDAYASYEENITFTRDRKREEFAEAIETNIDAGLNFVGNVGHSALKYTAEAGLVTLGVGFLAAEATKAGAEKAYASGKDVAETGVLKALYAADAIKEGFNDTKETIRSKLSESAEAAKSRRDARRERWSAKKSAAKEIIDANIEKGRRALSPLRAGRAAIQAALSAGRSTYSTHIDQDKL